MGYLSSALLLAAGIVYMVGDRPGLGILFIAVSLATVVLNIFIYRRK